MTSEELIVTGSLQVTLPQKKNQNEKNQGFEVVWTLSLSAAQLAKY